MSELVDRAKASLEGVDPYGPWDVEPFSDGSFGVYAADSLHATCRDKNTAEFIAAARQLVPELIAEVERLEDAIVRFDRYARGMAISAQASGDVEESRRWLDLLALIERRGRVQ